jgi:hypothetical protein
MHLRERFFKGVTELGHMTDRHHYNIPAILRGSHNRSSYYNTMFFLLGVPELDPMTDRHTIITQLLQDDPIIDQAILLFSYWVRPSWIL